MVRRRYAAYGTRQGRIVFARYAWTLRGAEIRAGRMYEAAVQHELGLTVSHGRRADW